MCACSDTPPLIILLLQIEPGFLKTSEIHNISINR
jgi:hypothetical protein